MQSTCVFIQAQVADCFHAQVYKGLNAQAIYLLKVNEIRILEIVQLFIRIWDGKLLYTFKYEAKLNQVGF